MMPRLGTRKLYFLLEEEFKKEGIKIGRDGLFTLLREECLLVLKKKRYTITTNSKHWMRRYPNLIKDIIVERPEQVWVADITYVPVAKGFNYLHIVTDAYSKKIMGFNLSPSLAPIETKQALDMAIKSRSYTGELIHHSDRGLQYSSAVYTDCNKDNNIKISMTENGDPYENAVAERINGILKDEFGLDEVIPSAEIAEKLIKQSIDIYNTQRPHLSNSYRTPQEMHQQSAIKPKLWHKKNRGSVNTAPVFVPSIINKISQPNLGQDRECPLFIQVDIILCSIYYVLIFAIL
jgi:putative transposase